MCTSKLGSCRIRCLLLTSMILCFCGCGSPSSTSSNNMEHVQYPQCSSTTSSNNMERVQYQKCISKKLRQPAGVTAVHAKHCLWGSEVAFARLGFFMVMLSGWTLQDRLGRCRGPQGTAWKLCGWALQGHRAVGTARILCRRALPGYTLCFRARLVTVLLLGYAMFGNCWDTVLCGSVLQGYSAVGHCWENSAVGHWDTLLLALQAYPAIG